MRRTRTPLGLLVAAALATFVTTGCVVAAGFALGAMTGRAAVGAPVGRGQRVLAGGIAIDASVGGGWFTAWPPGEQPQAHVEAYDVAGTRIAEQDL